MSGQRRWLRTWARTVGMPVGIDDDDKPEFLPITQSDVKKALAFRTFWISTACYYMLYDYYRKGRT